MKKLCVWLLALLSIECAEKPFIEGELTGQLGNQMFVIAATVSLALDHDAEPVFPGFILDSSNNIPLNYQKVFYHLNVVRSSRVRATYREPSADYSSIPYQKNMRICGYFQSENYFRHHKKEIVELLLPRPEIVSYLQTKYGHLLESSTTVSIHMRSYADEDPTGKVYRAYGREYFKKAMALFPEDALFFVFSNRMERCKKELEGLDRRMIFVEGEPHYCDLYLMSMCEHNIICNSSFSWWAAYLNQNPDKIVVAPHQWYMPGCGIGEKDLVPKEWIRL